MAPAFLSTRDLAQQLLQHANREEILSLTRIFDAKATLPNGPGQVAFDVFRAGGHSVGKLRNQGVP